jgi:hypothetical protein
MNDLKKYISEITKETNAEDIKNYLLNFKTLSNFKTQYPLITNEANCIKLYKVYQYYKNALITRKQKDEVKDFLINNGYIIPSENKRNKIYNININKINEFSDWINDNLDLN